MLDNKKSIRSLNETEEKRIREILAEEGLIALGIGPFDNGYIIGAKVSNYEELTKKVSDRIKEELGINTTINL